MHTHIYTHTRDIHTYAPHVSNSRLLLFVHVLCVVSKKLFVPYLRFSYALFSLILKTLHLLLYVCLVDFFVYWIVCLCRVLVLHILRLFILVSLFTCSACVCVCFKVKVIRDVTPILTSALIPVQGREEPVFLFTV